MGVGAAFGEFSGDGSAVTGAGFTGSGVGEGSTTGSGVGVGAGVGTAAGAEFNCSAAVVGFAPTAGTAAAEIACAGPIFSSSPSSEPLTLRYNCSMVAR